MSQSTDKTLRKSSFICLFASTSCGEIFRSWTARQARSHVRTNLAEEGTPKLATFGPTIARRSPFGGTRKGTALPDLRAEAILWRRRVCCRIGCMLRTGRLLVDHTKGTEGSNLTLSATQSALQRKASGLLACKRCNIRNRSGRLPDHGHGNFRLFATLNSLDSNSSDILRQTPIFKTGQVGPNNRRYRPTSSVTSVISSF